MPTQVLGSATTGQQWEKTTQNLWRNMKNAKKFGNISHLPTEELNNIVAPWPFAPWGVDILGRFSTAKEQLNFLLVGIDHFVKWIEVEPVATISTTNFQKLIWKNIVCCFGIPNTLIFDNGKQFINKGVEEFLANLGIKNRSTSMEHPQRNWQTKAVNKAILEELKNQVGKAKTQLGQMPWYQ